MHKMNFEQTLPTGAEVRGPSGTVLLLVAIACVTLTFILHAWL
jgi:hypothetical protein